MTGNQLDHRALANMTFSANKKAQPIEANTGSQSLKQRNQ
jgi:hypothetical protein